MTNINERQLHISIRLDGDIHILTIAQIRQLAAGCRYSGNPDMMIQLLAKAIKGMLDESVN